MKQLKQETGRSMVEMLGVLAVIGVLSVGGISGYTLAMNKHRANSVAADLMKRAVVISAQRQLGQTPNVQGLGSKVGDYEIDQTVDTSAADKFAMTVKDVPEEVCEKILALDWQNATITPATAEGCNGGNMIFAYNNDLSPVTCTGTVCGVNCCPAGATCGENNECCIGNLTHDGVEIACAPEGYEVYCGTTNEQGECVYWYTCPEGKSSKDWIVGMSLGSGYCVGEGEELYCSYTNSQGECVSWYVCAEGKSTGDSVVGVKPDEYGGGACAWEGQELYCRNTNAQGECYSWDACAEGKSTGDSIEGVSSATGACASEGRELYCGRTNAEGKCSSWSTCAAGKSSGDSIIGTPDAQGTCNG